MRRTLSTGFVLQEDSLDDEFYNELHSSSDENQQLLLDKYEAELNGKKKIIIFFVVLMKYTLF